MKPKSISATALHVADLCLARYHAENILRGERHEENRAALLGTTVHAALEFYVKTAIMEPKTEPTLTYLLSCFETAFQSFFGAEEKGTEEHKDGIKMCKSWHKRTDFSDVEVLSCEVKSNFEVPTSEGPLTFNYIWDRADKIKEGVYRIVDYKSSRWNVNHDDLKKKIQPRAYAVAAAIQFKDAQEIWVEFDMLRHDRVGIVFSREDNIVTWKWIKETAQRIIDADEDNPPETLNPECMFCIRKQTCTALRENISIGGVFSTPTPGEAIDLRAKMEYQKKGLESAIKELDSIIMPAMKEEDTLEMSGEKYLAKIGVSSRREVDGMTVERIVGSDKFQEYGGFAITVVNYEKLCEDPDLTDEQKSQLPRAIHKNIGEPKIKTDRRPSMGP